MPVKSLFCLPPCPGCRSRLHPDSETPVLPAPEVPPAADPNQKCLEILESGASLPIEAALPVFTSTAAQLRQARLKGLFRNRCFGPRR
jgi:hypothetical protein